MKFLLEASAKVTFFLSETAYLPPSSSIRFDPKAALRVTFCLSL